MRCLDPDHHRKIRADDTLLLCELCATSAPNGQIELIS